MRLCDYGVIFVLIGCFFCCFGKKFWLDEIRGCCCSLIVCWLFIFGCFCLEVYRRMMVIVIIVFVVSSFSDVFDMFVYRKKVIIKILRCYKKVC